VEQQVVASRGGDLQAASGGGLAPHLAEVGDEARKSGQAGVGGGSGRVRRRLLHGLCSERAGNLGLVTRGGFGGVRGRHHHRRDPLAAISTMVDAAHRSPLRRGQLADESTSRRGPAGTILPADSRRLLGGRG
jgi:hypothetical protein